MSLRGQVGTMALEDVLEWAVRRKVTGTLTCERNGRVRALALEGGAVQWASSSMPEEQLGQILLATGGITEDGLADALGVRSETQVPLGRILLMVGAVREDDVVTALAAKIREGVSDLVTWTEGGFDFDPHPPLGGGVSAPINLDVCLTIARRRVQRWAAIRAAIPDEHSHFYARRTEPPEIDSPIDATRVWALAIANESAARIVAACGGERYAVLDHLAQLITSGALGLDRRTKPRTESASELAQGARARLRTGDRAAALEMAERAKALAPTDPDARSAHSVAERARVAEVARTLLAKHRVPRLRRSPAEIAEMDLTDLERRLVHRIDGRWDLLSLIRTASVRESEALLAIAKLAERGVVELSKA